MPANEYKKNLFIMRKIKKIDNYVKTYHHKNEIVNKLKEIVSYEKNEKYFILSDESFNFINEHVFYYENDRFIVFDKKFYFSLSKKYNASKHLYILDLLPSYTKIIDDSYKNFIIDKINEVEAKKNYPTWFIDNNKDINYDNLKNLNYIRSLLLQGKSLREISNGEKTENRVTEKYWTFRGWSKSEAKLKIMQIQKENAKKFIKKKKENPVWAKEVSSCCIEHWLKLGYSESEAKEKLKSLYSFTLEKCIKKYGEKQGTKIFKDRQIRWQNTLKNKKDYLEIVVKRQNNRGFSNISQELFDAIYDKIKHLNLKIYYAKLNHEYGIGIHNRRGCLYDFVITDIKYAIEFNGNRFHPNKEKLSKDEWNNWKQCYTNKSADEVFKLDTEKNNAIIHQGYILDIIWEDDYIQNKEVIINNIYNKILKLYESKF